MSVGSQRVFSNVIASIMRVFDNGINGCRNIILPLAFQDDLVQRAMCVVSAFHLAPRNHRLYAIAEADRSAIIARLAVNATSGNAGSILNVSTWATILVLLVGEALTGSEEFGYLYNMITTFLQGDRSLTGATPETSEILLQQTRMFQLFTPSLISPDSGTAVLSGNLDKYFDFLICQQLANPDLDAYIIIFTKAIRLVRDMYLEELGLDYQLPTPSLNKVEILRKLTGFIKQKTPGSHGLLWVYFIAFASSCDPFYQQYFTSKLHEVYCKTQMNNILSALKILEEVWRRFPDGGWAQNLILFRPVLAV
ncbi:hypothetical protein K431DRAFT_325665 [Polychaeton citri CBS 116435]|uniref:Uncharacterized protein n=1 Tax=Polychaeton citri CBS 116435 TaxID=1314669 RepID=A0A9P4UHX6_9PEZI|nr:hypothetical protein K431DRAFT_325665 [Polychaeton citri CBS 116435]